MADPRILSPNELSELASRLLSASGSIKVPRPLRSDLVAAALVITTLLRTGAIAGPITLGGRTDG